MNYSINKVQASYFIVLSQSNFHDYKNSHTFPSLWAFSLTLAEFPDISRFPDMWLPVLNLHLEMYQIIIFTLSECVQLTVYHSLMFTQK